ncbi:hypothetical protein PBS_28750 [Paraburkholderia sp. 2C]
MPITHIPESYRRPLYETAPPALPPVSAVRTHAAAPTAGSMNTREAAVHDAANAAHFVGIRESSVPVSARTGLQADAEAVLRLRGGGGAQSRSGTGADDDPLLPESAGSRYRAYHGGASGSGESRIRNIAKRHELEAKVSLAKGELAIAKQKFQAAQDAIDVARMKLARLEDERAGFAADPARRDEIERQISAANDDYQSKTFAAWPYRTAVERSEKDYRRLQEKLDRLPWA